MTNKKIITLQTLDPHSIKQEIIMRAFITPELREVFVACGTKFGKSVSASTALVNGIIKKKGGTYRWIAPIYRQSKIGMEYFRNIAPPPPHSEIIESKMLMRFPELKSNIEFWHTQSPLDLEGAGIMGQVGDEAAKMVYQVYISAMTTTTFTKAPSMWISTPYGKNWFYKKYLEAKDHMEWSIKKGIAPTKIAIHAPTSANRYVDKLIIDQAKKDMPYRLFRQYFLAEFLDDGSVFIGFRKCLAGRMLEFDNDSTQFWFAEGIEKLDVVIGVDWAKHKDYTVMIAIQPDCNPRRVVGFMRFQGLGYTQAIKELWMFAKKFESVGVIMHDKTGVGEAIDDMLSAFPLNIIGVTFTNPMKSNMVNILGMSFEKQELELPHWPQMLKELDSYEVKINKLGTTIYNATEGSHDDIVMSLGLANIAANEYAGDFEVRYLEELPEYGIDKFYSQIMDDDEYDGPL